MEEKNMDLHHFYHIYCAGNWFLPTNDHIHALKKYGLLDSLKTFQVGLVGPKNKREDVKKYLKEQGIKFKVCTEKDDGWEQETQDEILKFAQKNDGYVLYAHTKNAVNINQLHIDWRRSMTYFTTVIWKDCVKKMDSGYSAVGSHYIQGSNENVHTESGFFGGTFWWTHLKYIKDFSPAPRHSRWGAEEWIGNLKGVVESQGDIFEVYDYNPTHPAEKKGMITQW
jgi:hypothetical protein